ncbi:hypothetical protein H105_03112 [Trichophyton soudanense CBS 452.61]|uniref:Uncharacterized protein n=1 Tax=Trichophyton soudanense CBS 452.61 TaxID=1215331 RepID=A0A022XX87_TRISD|nr:hypothetical protein H105_03112 [Trichophyton soudanense CBS 452.61]EZG07657.1 hypothetical protein H106_02941 [Trichophyton rubrum CBS 735.88]
MTGDVETAESVVKLEVSWKFKWWKLKMTKKKQKKQKPREEDEDEASQQGMATRRRAAGLVREDAAEKRKKRKKRKKTEEGEDEDGRDVEMALLATLAESLVQSMTTTRLGLCYSTVRLFY